MAEREAIDSQKPEEPMIRGGEPLIFKISDLVDKFSLFDIFIFFDPDPPIARKNSLKRFLDKRKERCRGTITGRPLIRLP